MKARGVKPGYKLAIALAALSIFGFAQIDSGAREVHRLANGASIGDFSVASVDFPDLRLGAPRIANIKLTGQSAVRTIKFESIDANGRLIDLLPALRADGEYQVLVNIPQQPFRIRASGADLTGATYERVFRRLFQHSTVVKQQSSASPINAELLSRFESEKQQHPDGIIMLSAVDVYGVGYGQLSLTGSVVGIRVWYSVKFAADGEYSLAPQVSPVYEDADLRGLVSMRILREKVDPAPEVSQGVNMLDLLQTGAPAKYRAGTEYRVVLDMIPDYIYANSYETKFCIFEAKFPAQGKGRDAWNLVKSDPTPIKYAVKIPGLSFTGETEPFYPLRTFYEAFLKRGAFDCGPSPAAKF